MDAARGAVAAALAVVALGSTALVAVAQTPVEEAHPLSPREEAGRDLYLRDCAWCHGSTGEGTPRGSRLIDVGAASAHFMLATGRMPIDVPTTELRRADPAYTPEEIDALVAFVATLGEGPDIPDVDPAVGDLTLGEEIYRVQCAACHGPIGTGAALTGGRNAPPLREPSPVEVAESLVVGPGPMPVFVPGILDEHEMNSVVRYVSYLRDPTNRGGWGLGNLGPVSEGFVAWVAAVVPLVFFVVYIGERLRD